MTTISIPSLRVLVVEDVPVNIKIADRIISTVAKKVDQAVTVVFVQTAKDLKRALRGKEFTAYNPSTGKGEKATSNGAFDLIVMDNQFPKTLEGTPEPRGEKMTSVLRESLKETGKRPYIAVCSTDDVKWDMNVFDAILPKRFSTEDAIKILNAAADRKKEQQKVLKSPLGFPRTESEGAPTPLHHESSVGLASYVPEA
jgi:CheY-like chemotaxis protein